MAEYDRVRYAQGGEPPLAFDRRAPARAGPAPVTLILSLLLLAGVGGGVFYMYRGGLRGPGDAPRPVGAPVGEVRVAAPAQAQPPDPGAGLTIYRDDPNATPATPAFVPPPEKPSPRPSSVAQAHAPASPTASALATAAIASAALAPVKPSTTATKGSASALASTASAPAAHTAKPSPQSALNEAAPVSPAGTTAAAKSKAKPAKAATIDSLLADAGPAAKPSAKPTTLAKADAKDDSVASTAASGTAGESAPASPSARQAKTPAAAKPGAPSGKPAVVQVGAYSSKDLAEAGWTAAAGASAGEMSGKIKHIVPITKAGKPTLYRTSITGFTGPDQAQAFCARLKAAGQSCFVR